MTKGLQTAVLTILLGCIGPLCMGQPVHPAGVTISSGDVTLHLQRKGFRYDITRAGRVVVGADATAGLLLGGEPIASVTDVRSRAARCSMRIATQGGERGTATITLSQYVAAITVTPVSLGAAIEYHIAGASPGFGLADHATYDRAFNTDITGFSDDDFLSGQGTTRLVSNFMIYPKNGFAVLLIDPYTKIVRSSAAQIVEGVQHGRKSVTFDILLGTPHEIYATYRELRQRAGYPVMQPKYRMFGVGWEAFGALGWNTNQNTVRESVDRYLSLGYPLQWIVIGSGYWPAPPEDHATTSFGMFNRQLYPDPAALFAHFHQENLKILLGLRIAFLVGGPFTGQGLQHGYFIEKNGESTVYRGSWPKLPYYLLNAHDPAALHWYLSLVKRWGAYGVQGYKEDYYGFHGLDLRDDKIDPVNTALMEEGRYVIERNGYLSCNGDLQRIDDFNYDQDQDRGPVNALALAYSGFPFVYPDIVGGTFGEKRFGLTDRKRLSIYLERNAQWAALHSSMAMGEPPWKFEDPKVGQILLQSAKLHASLQPYLYSESVRATRDGFPWTMTPLPLAYPSDPRVYGRDNERVRGYEWLIGDALLATPLYGNDYATAETRNVYLPAGKWMEFDTGKIIQGPKLLNDYPLPVGKTPLFIGGSALVLVREENSLVVRAYPLHKRSSAEFWFPRDKTPSKIVLDVPDWKRVNVVDLTTGQSVPGHWSHSAFEFPIHPSHNYRVH